MNIRQSAILGLLVAVSSLSFAEAQNEDLVFTGKPSEFEDYGYFVRGAAWLLQEPVIFVCWENPTASNKDARDWVKDQIEKTWQLHTPIEFRGWQTCAKENSGIRILWSDEGARVQQFGRHIDGVEDGMILNDTFQEWNQSCQQMRELCVRSIAVHEFGHALGFAHEQNRPDTPGECSLEHGQGQPGEIMLTPYDPASVMNYCNMKYNNDGLLSPLDILAIQRVYGKPQ